MSKEEKKEKEEYEEKDDFEEIKEMQKTQELKKITEEKENEKKLRKEEKKSSSLLVTLLVFALLIVFFFLGFAVGGSNIIEQVREKKLVKNNTTNESITEEVLSTAKDFDLGEAKKLLDEFGFNINLGCDSYIFGKFYDDSYKARVAIENARSKAKEMTCTDLFLESDIVETSNDGSTTIKGIGVCSKNKANVIAYDDVNSIYHKMFGEGDMPKTINTSGSIERYAFLESKNVFAFLSCGGCGWTCGPTFVVNELKSAKEIGNKLYIDVYYYDGYPFTGSYGNERFLLETRKVSIDNHNIKTIDDAQNEIKNKYLDQLDLYEVEFEKVDGHYQFVRLNEKLS